MTSNQVSKTIDPQREFLKWKLYCQTHAKSILELDPQLNVVVRKYSIKQLWELGNAYPVIKPKVEDYLKMFLRKGQAEKIAAEFNVDMYCIYEDFVELVEMLYKAAEEAYQDEIEKDNMENYLAIIAIYRLIIDMTDLTVIWKEKDEKIKKFQLFCKYKVVNIMDKKEKTGVMGKEQSLLDKELDDIAMEVEIDRKDDRNQIKDKDNYKTDEELIDEFTRGDNEKKKRENNRKDDVDMNRDQNKTDEELIEEFTYKSNGIKKGNNDYDDDAYDIIKNADKLRDAMEEDIKTHHTEPNKKKKNNDKLFNDYWKEENRIVNEKKINSKPQYNKLIKNMVKLNSNVPQSEQNAKLYGIPFIAKTNERQGNQNKQGTPLNSKALIQSNVNKKKPVTIMNSNKPQLIPSHKPNVAPNNKRKENNIKSNPNSNHNKQKHNNSFTKKRSNANKDDYYICVFESMMQETNDIIRKASGPIKSPQKKQINPQEKPQTQHQPQAKKVSPRNDGDIIDINAYNFDPQDNTAPTSFKQISTPMLSQYKYPGNCKYTSGLPVKFKSDDYNNMHNCIMKVLMPMIEKDIQSDKNGKALHESEMVLYYLTNIIP